jgi:hypothetical protein
VERDEGKDYGKDEGDVELVPLINNVVEMLEDDPAGCPFVGGTHVVGVYFDRLECLGIQPVLSFGIAPFPASMDAKLGKTSTNSRNLYT